MSNNRSDDNSTIAIPDAASFDWNALRACAAAFDPTAFDGQALYNIFFWCEDQLGHDPGEFLGIVGGQMNQPPPAPDAAKMRAILLADVELVRERATNPDPYLRDSENYETFGYGFDILRVGSHVVLVGSYNEYCAAAGEVPETDLYKMESHVFDRLIGAGLLSAAH